MPRMGLICLALFSLVFSDCRTVIRGYPRPPQTSQKKPPDPEHLLGQEAIKAYHLKEGSLGEEAVPKRDC